MGFQTMQGDDESVYIQFAVFSCTHTFSSEFLKTCLSTEFLLYYLEGRGREVEVGRDFITHSAAGELTIISPLDPISKVTVLHNFLHP